MPRRFTICLSARASDYNPNDSVSVLAALKHGHAEMVQMNASATRTVQNRSISVCSGKFNFAGKV